MSAYVCIHVYICRCIYVYICIHIYMSTYLYLYIYIYIYIIETAWCATHSIWMLRDSLQSLGSCTASKR